MATLKRPEICACGSSNMLREKNPERYVCMDCKSIIISRGTKPDHNTCRVCKAQRGSVDFKENKNLCIPCYRDAMKQYRADNLESLKEKRRSYYKDNQPRLRKRANQYYQLNIDAYLRNLARRTLLCARRRDGGRRRELEHDITFECIKSLYDASNGKCALTGLPMRNIWNSPYSISCDRIDSDRGYIEGNVQLVCKWVNLAKNNHSNSDFQSVLDDYYNLRKSQEAQ